MPFPYTIHIAIAKSPKVILWAVRRLPGTERGVAVGAWLRLMMRLGEARHGSLVEFNRPALIDGSLGLGFIGQNSM